MNSFLTEAEDSYASSYEAVCDALTAFYIGSLGARVSWWVSMALFVLPNRVKSWVDFCVAASSSSG